VYVHVVHPFVSDSLVRPNLDQGRILTGREPSELV
jgi:hypothetical protein